MKQTRQRVVVVAAVAVAATLGLSGVFFVGSDSSASYPEPGYTEGIDRMATADAITFFEGRVAGGKDDPITLTTLGQLYLTRFRETGDAAFLSEAEGRFGAALAARPDHADALLGLAAVAQAEHKFDEALALAESAHAAEPSPTTITAQGDIAAALGDYDVAQAAYLEAAETGRPAAVLPGQALIAEVHGRSDEAVRLLELAAEAAFEAHLAGEAVAWYQQRLGDVHFELGEFDEAERRFEAARELFPESHDAPAALGRVAAARADYQRAIELFEEAIAVSAQPDLLIGAGDLYLVVGDDERAEQRFAAAVDGLIVGPDERLYARDLATFYADHDREVEEALRLAQADAERRPDVHGYDTLAWALYRNGRFDEARQASDSALQYGTRDAVLWYHAGLISAALGDLERADRELSTALEINPHFDPIHAPLARGALEELRATA